jgi:hypothetical protein
MLTTTSTISLLGGYQDQRNISVKDSSTSVSKTEDSSGNQNDQVTLSRKARTLQRVYEKKETVLEQNYTNETQRLESEFIQAKSRLEKEHSQKKQSLEINVYA